MMRAHAHFLLLTWLLSTGLVAFGMAVIVDQHLLQALLSTDQSKISLVVLAMYAFGLAHSLLRTWYLSAQLNLAAETERAVSKVDGTLEFNGGVLSLRGAALPKCFVVDFMSDALITAKSPTEADHQSQSRTLLLEAHAIKWRGANDFGWFFIDAMLKVGFLGTLIGFILMLGSISGSANLDASMLQQVLQKMSFGMSTALNTTLISLVGGILLSVPYYLLERGLDELLEVTVRTTETIVLPRFQGGD